MARRWRDDRGAARIAAWSDRVTELYYDSEPTVTDDGASYRGNAHGRFTLRLDEDESGRTIRIQTDWPEPEPEP